MIKCADQLIARIPFLGWEYRRILTCVSSKTRSHDVVGVSREAKMESSQGEGEGYFQGGVRAPSILDKYCEEQIFPLIDPLCLGGQVRL